MAEFSAITNLVNAFARAYSLTDGAQSVKDLLALFTEDAAFTDELIGSCQGKSEIEGALTERLALKFLADTVHVPSGHVVKVADGDHATVTSTTVTYWKCVPVMVVKWEDAVVKVDGQWHFQSRVADAVQKNLEMIGEMQLRGKKHYAQKDDE